MNDQRDIENLLRGLKEHPEATPSSTFRTNARIRILNTVSRLADPPWYRRPRYWGYATGSAIATVALTVGTVFAAQSSNPDSRLYPVKVLSERVALTLAPTENLKNDVAGTIITRRIDEIEHEQKSGDIQGLDDSIKRFNTDLEDLQGHKELSREHINSTISGRKSFLNSLRSRGEDKIKTPENREENRSGESESDTVKTNDEQRITPTPSPATQFITPRVELKLPEVEDETQIRHDD